MSQILNLVDYYTQVVERSRELKELLGNLTQLLQIVKQENQISAQIKQERIVTIDLTGDSDEEDMKPDVQQIMTTVSPAVSPTTQIANLMGSINLNLNQMETTAETTRRDNNQIRVRNCSVIIKRLQIRRLQREFKNLGISNGEPLWYPELETPRYNLRRRSN